MKKLKLTGYGWIKPYFKSKLDDLPLDYIKKVESFFKEMNIKMAEPFESRRLDKGNKNLTQLKRKKMKNKFIKRYAKGIKLDVRNKGTCYVTMKTNAGELTVYIDAMDGLTDPPMVSAWIPGRRTKEIFIK